MVLSKRVDFGISPKIISLIYASVSLNTLKERNTLVQKDKIVLFATFWAKAINMIACAYPNEDGSSCLTKCIGGNINARIIMMQFMISYSFQNFIFA